MARIKADTRNVEIGARIRMARLRLGLSQSELGDLVGVTYQQINKYESGRNSISAVRAIDVSNALEVPTGWLLGVASKMEPAAPFGLGKTALRVIAALERMTSEADQRMVLHLVERVGGHRQMDVA